MTVCKVNLNYLELSVIHVTSDSSKFIIFRDSNVNHDIKKNQLTKSLAKKVPVHVNSAVLYFSET